MSVAQLLSRRSAGSAIVEGAAGLMILIPLLILIVYVVLEASHAYFIYGSLQQGAQEAARALATYPVGQPPGYVNFPLTPGQIQAVLQPITVSGVINDPSQFTPTFIGPPSSPTSVVVTVKYTSGQNGLPVFPDADVLNLGSSFQLQASATYQVN
jgi:hypothetical protein